MIPSEVIHRVFRIRWRGKEGTAFAIDIEGRQYLVTAKHIVAAMTGADSVDLFGNGQWEPIPIRLVGHASPEIDISVIAGERLFVPPGLPIEASSRGAVYGQDVYFLGFPYGIVGNYVLGGGG